MAEDKKEEIKIIEINEEYMKDRLYVFRGRKVMLDTDLAEIYGYETKNLRDRSRIILQSLKAMILCLN